MLGEKRIRIEIVWRDNDPDRRTTFLEFVTLPDHVSQQEFLQFCIDTTERAKTLGAPQEAMVRAGLIAPSERREKLDLLTGNYPPSADDYGEDDE